MLSLFNRSPKAAVLAPPVTPFPSAALPECLVAFETQRRYEEVAKTLGFDPPELTRAQLIEFFTQEDIVLYNYDEVNRWLKKKRQEAGLGSWCWRPLRGKDVITEYRWGWGRADGGWLDGFYMEAQCPPYDRLVPMHALEKVVKIEAKFGDKVKFFVSDYASPNADPFIMVRPAKMDSSTDGSYHLVFDCWDEPGFGQI